MKKVFFLIMLLPGLALSSELATYSVRIAIDGLQLPNVPPGTGDRVLEFTTKFPADSAEAADIFWYEHLKRFFGDDDQQALRALRDKFQLMQRR